MSLIWPHANKEHLCPICQKPDWCTFGDRAVLCQRVESKHPATKGGWYHFYDQTEYRPPVNLPKKSIPARIFPASMVMGWWENTADWQTESLASKLGVSVQSLEMVGAVWATEYRAWAFPMKDGKGNIIGIRLRNDEGFKWAVTGSRQGIFIPSQELQKIAFLPEGPTDTAACLSLGLFTIGRPTCNSGVEYIKEYLAAKKIFRAVIVGDRDELKNVGNERKRPGVVGAIKLKSELGIKSVIWYPPAPHKDVREFLNAGGTGQVVRSSIEQKVWTNK